MTAADLHDDLTRRGLTVLVKADGCGLLVSPKAKLTEDLSAAIRENKGGLLAYLTPPRLIEWLLKEPLGDVVASTFGDNWFPPSGALSWRVPPGAAWKALAQLPPAWGLAEAHDPAYDPFREARVTKHGTCFNCGGLDFWTSRLFPDVRRCRRCVPPVSGAEVTLE
jgi:hypothetical protein